MPGDAATTAGNVLANAGLVRIGVVANLLQATIFVFLAMTLYVLLKDVSTHVARAMVILVAIATTMMCLNEVFQFAALLVATDQSYSAIVSVCGRREWQPASDREDGRARASWPSQLGC